jgi:hypothetical protein
MDAAAMERFYSLKDHLLDGAPRPAAPNGVVGNEQIFASDGTTILKPGEHQKLKTRSTTAAPALRSQELAEKTAEAQAAAEIARLEDLKTAAAADERYTEAAELKLKIQQLKDAQQRRQLLSSSAPLLTPPPPPPPPRLPPTPPVPHTPRAPPPLPPPIPPVSSSAGGLGRRLEESVGESLGNTFGRMGGDTAPPASPEEMEDRNRKRQKVEEMVTTLGISKRYVSFVSNLVEKGTYENVQDKELFQLGLSDDEVASFQVIKDWARMRGDGSDSDPKTEASKMRRQLRDVKEKKAREEARERVQRKHQAGEQDGQFADASNAQAARKTSGVREAAAAAAAAGTTEETRKSKAYCPMLPAIANGAVEYSNERLAPCTATFTCDEGYSLGGAGVTETVIDCVPAGRSALWSGAPPTCTPAAGSAPDDVDVPR